MCGEGALVNYFSQLDTCIWLIGMWFGWGSKNKHHKITCLIEIRLRFHISLTISHSVVNLGGCIVYYVWEPRAFMTPPKNPLVYEGLYVYIPLYTYVLRFKYMFNVSIREYFPVLNLFIVCIRNTARSKSIPLMCTHVDSYKFSTMHPPSSEYDWEDLWYLNKELTNMRNDNYD
jgi:hypothetical protein